MALNLEKKSDEDKWTIEQCALVFACILLVCIIIGLLLGAVLGTDPGMTSRCCCCGR